MTQQTYYSDEELVAFLDGETEFAPVEEIAAALEADPSLADRLAALRVDTEAIKKGFAPLALTDRPMPDLDDGQATRGQSHWAGIAAAVLVALVVGFGAGRSLPGPDAPVAKAPGWKAYVASYQSLYASDTLSHIDRPQDIKDTELARVAATIGKKLEASDLSAAPQVDYKRAQILNFKGKPLIQLAFLTQDGAPVALCILRTNKEDTAGVTAATLEGMSAASWSKGGYDYLLIGGTDQTLISDMAAQYIGSI